jgi:hypothetical protein
MTAVEITFCNRAYADRWYEDLKTSNPSQFAVLQSLLDAISDADGGDINQADMLRRHPQVARYVEASRFRIVPSAGQLLVANGRGIRHAKYSPSKSIAIVWENIRQVIYVTFDDHAPIAYHRAIRHLRDIRLGRPALPKRARDKRAMMKLLAEFRETGHVRSIRRFNPHERYYR